MNKRYYKVIISILLSCFVNFFAQDVDADQYKEIVNAYQQGLLEEIIHQYKPEMSEEMMKAWDSEKLQKNESINRLMSIVESHCNTLMERKKIIESSYFFSLLGGITGYKNEAKRLQEQIAFDKMLLKELSNYLNYYIFY